MKIDQISDDGLSLLDKLLCEADTPDIETRPAQHFVWRHANFILQVAGDLMALHRGNRIHSMSVLIRPLFESLFNIAATAHNSSFVTQKHIAELEDNVKRLKRWTDVVGHQQENPFTDTIQAMSAQAEELRTKFSISSRKEWNTWDIAHESKLDHHYVQEFFMFSHYTHASIAGLISQETGDDRLQVVRSAIYVPIAASAYSAQVLHTSCPQSYVDEATDLLNSLTEMTKQGTFRK